MERISNLKISQGDILIANGDFLGGRGPITNKIVKVFYEVKRGETSKYELQEIFSAVLKTPVFIEDDLVFRAIHSGTFLAEMCRRFDGFNTIVEDETRHNIAQLDKISKKIGAQGGRLVYLPGNGEITISDFDVTSGVDGEKTLPPSERLFNRLAEEKVFSAYGTEYVNQPQVIQDNTLLIPIDFLDQWIDGKTAIPNAENIVNLIVHYPPFNPKITDCFYKLFGFKTNEMDILRMNAVSGIIKCLPNLDIVVFGHIHPGINKESIEKLPTSVIFKEFGHQLVWNAPGNVFALQ